MKKLGFITTLVLSISLLGLVGCSKSGGIDTTKVQSAFQTASTVDKAEVEKAITAIKAGDFAAALASLQKAVASANVTAEQKSSLQDLINEVQAKVSDAAKKAVSDATKAAKEGADKTATDLQKAIGK